MLHDNEDLSPLHGLTIARATVLRDGDRQTLRLDFERLDFESGNSIEVTPADGGDLDLSDAGARI